MFKVILRYFNPFYTLFKKLSKIQKFFKKCHNFHENLPNSSYTYHMKGKLMSADVEFDGKTRERVQFHII
jgi:hypothetical protein